MRDVLTVIMLEAKTPVDAAKVDRSETCLPLDLGGIYRLIPMINNTTTVESICTSKELARLSS